MSYDLFFHKPGLTESQFSAYFSARPNFKLGPKQAVYENEDTGVYFSFDFGIGEDDAEVNDEGEVNERPDASFNLNYFRPHFFGLEAEPEVRAFVEHFDPRISDPQQEGMDEGPYSAEGFLRGWNHGNELGYRAVFSMQEDRPEVVGTLPTAELDSSWRWNFNRQRYQDKLGEGIFVPSIMFVKFGSELRSVVVWPDGIPALLPIVDGLIVGRQGFAPRRLFRRAPDTCYVSFDAARRVLPSQPDVSTYARPAVLLNYASPPGEIVQFVKGLKPVEKLEGVDGSQVLNRELVEKAKASR